MLALGVRLYGGMRIICAVVGLWSHGEVDVYIIFVCVSKREGRERERVRERERCCIHVCFVCGLR